VRPSAFDRTHSSVWVRRPSERRGRVVRVAWDGDTAVCFGDGPLADFADRDHVFVDVGTGSGTLEHEFAARLRDLVPELVADELLLDLVDHVSLGLTVEEVEESLDRMRQRRLVALVA
jgi:hypothetical protein